MKTDIYAVVWNDFIPLSLLADSEADAISKAQAMHAKATLSGVTLGYLKAVRVTPEDKLITLWQPEEKE